MKFQGKTIIITGASGGIGFATAKKFASEGANIVLADINKDGLNKARDQLKGTGSEKVWISRCDVSQEKDVESTITGAIDNFGTLDTVVNNAGLMIFKKIEEQTENDWYRVLSVDLLGAFFFTKYAFLRMNKGGSIINISSIHAIETTPMVACYAAAKAALLSLTRSASMEGKAKGIRVNAILPGAIDTPMLWDNPNVKAGIEKIDIDSVGKPGDIAGAISFLASDEAEFVQGAMLRVDGGRLSKL
jgi:NAD(P)-dependent dehydrogenase (short-subunit alcohol dehydrogenase family)